MYRFFNKIQYMSRRVMRSSAFALLVAVLVFLVSCKQNEMKINDVEEPAFEQLQEQKEQVTVSPYAGEYFLEPLEKYSWEKEFDTEYIVLHFTSNVVADRENPYNMNAIRKIFEDNEISIHYIIDRDGKAYCYIPETHSAWHSGVGTYNNDEKYTNKMNKYSVGIEIVGIGSKNDMAQYLEDYEYDALDSSLVGFTDAQYETLKLLVTDICKRNNIPFDREHVIGHEEYNGNKTDPGELFDWDRVFE